MTAAPAFMSGMFLWGGHGYFFPRQPPAGMMAAAEHPDADPWIVLAAVLRQAQVGRFAALTELKRCLVPGVDPLLLRGCCELLGNAPTPAARGLLEETMQSRDADLRLEACGGACLSGSLDLIPSVLSARRSLARFAAREEASLMLSLLLEEHAGPVQTSVARPADEYSVIVKQRVAEIRRYVPAPVPIWQGRAYAVHPMTQRMLGELTAIGATPFELKVRFKIFRSRFEAATGINCSDCFREGRLQPLIAIERIESFVEETGPDTYRDGVRYFFGHPVPD